jgi:hypothetical protein
LNVAAGTAPRHADGSLPGIGLRLAAGSHLINAGTDVGVPYLGAFEFSRAGDQRGDSSAKRPGLAVLVRCVNPVLWP